MDKIFSDAVLAIVGLSTTNANNRLQGVLRNKQLPATPYLQGLIIASPSLISEILSPRN